MHANNTIAIPIALLFINGVLCAGLFNNIMTIIILFMLT